MATVSVQLDTEEIKILSGAAEVAQAGKPLTLEQVHQLIALGEALKSAASSTPNTHRTVPTVRAPSSRSSG
jgi:hypothetical protein